MTEYQTNVVNIKKYASDLHTYLTVKQIKKEVETHNTCLESLIKSDIIYQTKLTCKIDSGLKTIATNIQKFGEAVVEWKPCDVLIVRKKDKQAQMIVAELSPHMSVENIQLNLKQKMITKGNSIRACGLLPDGITVVSCWDSDTISFIHKDGVISFQIYKYKTGYNIYDTVYIKDNNSVALSSGFGRDKCITIIDIVSK